MPVDHLSPLALAMLLHRETHVKYRCNIGCHDLEGLGSSQKLSLSDYVLSLSPHGGSLAI